MTPLGYFLAVGYEFCMLALIAVLIIADLWKEHKACQATKEEYVSR